MIVLRYLNLMHVPYFCCTIKCDEKGEFYANIDFVIVVACSMGSGSGGVMKNVILTFCITSLMFTGAMLYGFMSGKIERPQTNYLDVMK